MPIIKVDYQKKYETLQTQFKQFAYTAAHDLRAPLRQIKQFSQIFIDDSPTELSPAQQEAVHYISASIAQGESLIDGLMTIAQLSINQNSFTECSLTTILDDALTQCHTLIQSTRASLQLPTHPATCFGDFEQLSLLIQCLLDNGLKFCHPNTPPQICINFEEDNHHVTLTISDNGLGIDKRYIEKIFEPFKQLNPEAMGVGIGLTLAKTIVDNHDGTLTVNSTPGVGSTFVVSLPKLSSLTD